MGISYSPAPVDSYSKDDADARFVNDDGDTLAGPLVIGEASTTLDADPQFANGYSGISRANGDPPRLLIARNFDQVLLDSADGLLRGADNSVKLRWSNVGVALNGVNPVARAAAITPPADAPVAYDQNQIQGIVNALNTVRAVIRDVGITL